MRLRGAGFDLLGLLVKQVLLLLHQVVHLAHLDFQIVYLVKVIMDRLFIDPIILIAVLTMFGDLVNAIYAFLLRAFVIGSSMLAEELFGLDLD